MMKEKEWNEFSTVLCTPAAIDALCKRHEKSGRLRMVPEPHLSQRTSIEWDLGTLGPLDQSDLGSLGPWYNAAAETLDDSRYII